jgi:hypothetical protein
MEETREVSMATQSREMLEAFNQNQEGAACRARMCGGVILRISSSLLQSHKSPALPEVLGTLLKTPVPCRRQVCNPCPAMQMKPIIHDKSFLLPLPDPFRSSLPIKRPKQKYGNPTRPNAVTEVKRKSWPTPYPNAIGMVMPPFSPGRRIISAIWSPLVRILLLSLDCRAQPLLRVQSDVVHGVEDAAEGVCHDLLD